MRKTIWIIAFLSLSASPLFAQDPVKVDPKHYSVVTENQQVRVLRIAYGPHEKSVMHAHPNAVAIFMTDAHFNFTLADGTTQKREGKAGDVLWTPAEKHLPENLGDQEARIILVELKAAKSTTTKKP